MRGAFGIATAPWSAAAATPLWLFSFSLRLDRGRAEATNGLVSALQNDIVFIVNVYSINWEEPSNDHGLRSCRWSFGTLTTSATTTASQSGVAAAARHGAATKHRNKADGLTMAVQRARCCSCRLCHLFRPVFARLAIRQPRASGRTAWRMLLAGDTCCRGS